MVAQLLLHKHTTTQQSRSHSKATPEHLISRGKLPEAVHLIKIGPENNLNTDVAKKFGRQVETNNKISRQLHRKAITCKHNAKLIAA